MNKPATIGLKLYIPNVISPKRFAAYDATGPITINVAGTTISNVQRVKN